MKAKLVLKAVGMTLAALFFSALELAYQACQYLIKRLIVAIILIIKAVVFIFLLPFSGWKCLTRAVRHRSFAAAGQLAKWIWLDYWKGFKL